ncbi:hypothetical protein J2Z40_002580 [Cytobacillus eiseniae]|uniref:Uncharacterized protein n=1 Tax=Cytobacillus eiseniae TaxID=762947 RepID=A0ABS4RGK8_9BACI|nr:hypothetical protein [Cytobacillus eiseniae]MBP2242007.1 hypothetical protein [Cytobacillus eiseniae]
MTNSHICEKPVLTKHEYYQNLLKSELHSVKSVKIPTVNDSICILELVDWIIEEYSPKQLECLVTEIKIMKKRTTNIKAFLAIIAIGLMNKN